MTDEHTERSLIARAVDQIIAVDAGVNNFHPAWPSRTGAPKTIGPDRGFRFADKRFLAPQVPLPPRAPRQLLCYEVVACPDAHDSRRCYEHAGHDGLHAWEMCPAMLSIDRHADEDVHCDLRKGHEGMKHRFAIEWIDQDFGARPR